MSALREARLIACLIPFVIVIRAVEGQLLQQVEVQTSHGTVYRVVTPYNLQQLTWAELGVPEPTSRRSEHNWSAEPLL